MVAEQKATDRDEAIRTLKAEGDKRREEVHADVNLKVKPVVKPGTGYTLPILGITFLAEEEPPELLDEDDKVMYFGKLVKEHPAGNCGEMAAVLYRFLRKQGATGLHFVNMKYNKLGVHSFVVIGANSIMQERNWIGHTDDAARAFGNDAIICDPWLGDEGEVFLVRDQWKEAVDQMIDEVTPNWNGSDEITFWVDARSSALSREQKVELWKAKQQPTNK